ncbi:MAG: CaiB/BaiF CoA-transferase family protein [Ralstonia sp.]|jgi:formyl-CoA transferase|uniref:Succinyl-CoA--L-malate CoA-transferase beta subunit n=7 Tax=Pseudomonadota TaxID=1224 RepID=A0AAD2BRR8_9RALS|nr:MULTISPECIES: CaiB/BaiF CoA-transferase family protein [Ralstonia]MEA3271961.1 CaiB/BaiF CoA-transferase family protein [Pseudomonadota bacterium]ENZ80041.1 putative acyl-CoA transferase/carnitine dehydratase [Ralstonia pickettii OR214]MBA4200377.1 CoA transferase [Ralstonia sp.]MBA4231059.1 CoA transferase [Ralstonia sp.]MBA4238707.1 CoA transferase [Ralstonia sp.]
MAQPDQPLPLQGIKVIELGSLIAGPYAGTLLAQFGAEVIKIETPVNGDPLRKWRKLHDGTSLWWYSQSRNKKSVTLNLKSERAQQIVRDLVKDADVVIENFRPGLMESWGLGWEQLSAINPKLVMVRISGYGQSGPYRERPGFAAIAESMGGLRYLSGYADRPPVRVGVSLGDSLASLYGVIGALLAMHHVKANRGTGQFIDVALYEAVFGIMESLIPEYAMFEHVRERTGSSLPGISPSNTYLCADGNYVIIAGNGDGIFKRLMQAIGLPEFAEDARFADNAKRVQHNDLLDGVIGEWTARHPIDAVLQVLEQADVPSGRIYTAADIARDPQYAARGMIERHTLPDGQPIDLPGIVPKLSATPGSTRWVGPELGEHTDEVLHALGLDAAALDSLRAEGII